MNEYVTTVLGSEEEAERLSSFTDKKLKEEVPYSFGNKIFFATFVPANFRNLGFDGLEVDKDFEKLSEIIESIGLLNGCKIAFSCCVSAKGYKHIHAVIMYDRNVRFKTVQKHFGKCWVQPVYGNKEQARAYMEKTGKYEEKGEKVLFKGGDWSILESIQGHRTDLEDFDRIALEPGFNLDEYLINHISPENSRLMSSFVSRYEVLMRLKASKMRRKHIKGIFIEGNGGSGKTWSINKRLSGETGLFEHEEIFRYNFDKKASFPFDGYRGERVLHLEELRPGMIPLDYLFILFDPIDFNINVKNGRMVAAWDTVVITSSMPLDDWLEFDENTNKSERDVEELEVRKWQLVRRIDEHYFCKNYKLYKDESFEEYKETIHKLSDLIVEKRGIVKDNRLEKKKEKIKELELKNKIDYNLVHYGTGEFDNSEL